MHVAILCIAYSLRLVKTGGLLYLAFATPMRSGEITTRMVPSDAFLFAVKN